MTCDEPSRERRSPYTPISDRHRKPTERTFVYADGPLAEVLCDAYLMELTASRSRQLRDCHRSHRPDDCWVHLQAASFLLADEDGI